MPVAVAVAERKRRVNAAVPLRTRTADAAIVVAELSRGQLAAQIVRNNSPDRKVYRSAEGACPGNVAHERNGGHRLDVNGQGMALVAGSGVGKIDSVKHNHSLVGRTSAYGNVRLGALAAPLAQVNRRKRTQRCLETLHWRCHPEFAVIDGYQVESSPYRRRPACAQQALVKFVTVNGIRIDENTVLRIHGR